MLWTTVTKSIAPLREAAAADENDGAKLASAGRPAASAGKLAPIAFPPTGQRTAAACPARPPHETARRTRQGKDRWPARSARPDASRGPRDIAALYERSKFSWREAGVGDYRARALALVKAGAAFSNGKCRSGWACRNSERWWSASRTHMSPMAARGHFMCACDEASGHKSAPIFREYRACQKNRSRANQSPPKKEASPRTSGSLSAISRRGWRKPFQAPIRLRLLIRLSICRRAGRKHDKPTGAGAHRIKRLKSAFLARSPMCLST